MHFNTLKAIMKNPQLTYYTSEKSPRPVLTYRRKEVAFHSHPCYEHTTESIGQGKKGVKGILIESKKPYQRTLKTAQKSCQKQQEKQKIARILTEHKGHGTVSETLSKLILSIGNVGTEEAAETEEAARH